MFLGNSNYSDLAVIELCKFLIHSEIPPPPFVIERERRKKEQGERSGGVGCNTSASDIEKGGESGADRQTAVTTYTEQSEQETVRTQQRKGAEIEIYFKFKLNLSGGGPESRKPSGRYQSSKAEGNRRKTIDSFVVSTRGPFAF